MKESGVTQLCPTLCDPMDCSLPGSSVHGVFQAIVLEWGAISFSLYCTKSSASGVYFTVTAHLNLEWLRFKYSVAMWLP